VMCRGEGREQLPAVPTCTSRTALVSRICPATPLLARTSLQTGKSPGGWWAAGTGQKHARLPAWRHRGWRKRGSTRLCLGRPGDAGSDAGGHSKAGSSKGCAASLARPAAAPHKLEHA
jgi:hypothetical protein